MGTIFSGYIPQNNQLPSWDGNGVDSYVTSPSGVYFAQLAPNGLFAVDPGSNPTINPCCGNGIPVLSASNAPSIASRNMNMQNDGNFVMYQLNSNGPSVPVAATNTNLQGSPPYYAEITDAGNLVIGQGTDPAHSTGTLKQINGFNSAVSSIDLTGITYDFSKAMFTGTNAVAAGSTKLQNTTDKPQTLIGNVTVEYTQSSSLSFAVANSVGVSISSTSTFGVPGISQESVTLGITASTTVTNGQATTTSIQDRYEAGAQPTVPANTTYEVSVTGTVASYDVPYTWTGVATYDNGMTADVEGTGLFTGGSEGNFTATLSCVSPPQSCDDIAPVTIPLFPVPEPATGALLPFALLGAAVARRLRTRSPAKRRLHPMQPSLARA
ncbi:MAG: aerolysin family beta-barrel pore-forming toxin [Acetobacteraceae bacterium]|nr:aerolysin family beta-barrel pore-forming toxin [Acetobacteraceae bacterium]